MELLPLIPLSFLVYTDYKEKMISIFPLLSFIAIQIFLAVWLFGINILIERVLFNLFILLMLSFGVYIYCKLRRLKVFEMTGLGDILFIIGLAPMFDTKKFLIFLIISLLISLLYWLANFVLRKDNIVPLVTTIGFSYGIYLIFMFLEHEYI